MAKNKKKDELDKAMEKMAYGLTPELVQARSRELHEEFETFLEDSGIEEFDHEGEDAAYKSWVGHKLAAMDLILKYIIDN